MILSEKEPRYHCRVKANSLNDSLRSAAMACCVHLRKAWDALGTGFSSTKLLDKTIVAITNALDYLVMVCGLVGPLLYSEDALYEVALVGCLDRKMRVFIREVDLYRILISDKVL